MDFFAQLAREPLPAQGFPGSAQARESFSRYTSNVANTHARMALASSLVAFRINTQSLQLRADLWKNSATQLR